MQYQTFEQEGPHTWNQGLSFGTSIFSLSRPLPSCFVDFTPRPRSFFPHAAQCATWCPSARSHASRRSSSNNEPLGAALSPVASSRPNAASWDIRQTTWVDLLALWESLEAISAVCLPSPSSPRASWQVSRNFETSALSAFTASAAAQSGFASEHRPSLASAVALCVIDGSEFQCHHSIGFRLAGCTELQSNATFRTARTGHRQRMTS